MYISFGLLLNCYYYVVTKLLIFFTIWNKFKVGFLHNLLNMDGKENFFFLK